MTGNCCSTRWRQAIAVRQSAFPSPTSASSCAGIWPVSLCPQGHTVKPRLAGDQDATVAIRAQATRASRLPRLPAPILPACVHSSAAVAPESAMRDPTVSAPAPWRVTPGNAPASVARPSLAPGNSITGGPVRHCPSLRVAVLPGVTPQVQRLRHAASTRRVFPGSSGQTARHCGPGQRVAWPYTVLPRVTRRSRGGHRPRSRHRVSRGNTPHGNVRESTIHQARLLPGVTRRTASRTAAPDHFIPVRRNLP